jgi:hypothetical protein
MGSVNSGSEGGMPTWFHNERANTIPDSKGDKKLRVDLFEMLNIEGVQKSTMDVANQFLVAAATDDVVSDSDEKKTAKLPGRVAVKIARENLEDETVYKYAFLNLNSLAKRLHVSAEDIKREEKEGTLDIFIKTTVEELAKQQHSMTLMLKAAVDGHPVFSPIIKQGAFFKPQLEGGEEKSEYQKSRDFLGDFIQKHFPDDTELMMVSKLF